MNRSLGRFATVSVLAGVLLALGGDAYAAKATVTDCSDDSDLRVKLAQLQTKKKGKLKFGCAGSPTIILTAPLEIAKKITIDGGPRGVTLSGGNARTLITIGSTGKLTLRRLVLTRGLNPTADGGAIVNVGRLTIAQCVLKDNRAAVGSGGAIFSLGPLTIRDSTLSSNQAANGGAIFPRFAAATTTIVRTSFADNRTTSATDGWGGAILIWDGASATVSDSIFVDNTARVGGAIYVLGEGSNLRSTRTEWERNRATVGDGGAVFNDGTFIAGPGDLFEVNGAARGGAIYNDGMMSVLSSTIAGNDADQAGGGVANDGRASLAGVTLSGNVIKTADGFGGALYNGEAMALFESTVSGNHAGYGGGLANDDPDAVTELTHVTMVDNHAIFAGGAIASVIGAVELVNSIVAASTPQNCGRPGGATGVVTSLGFNLSSDATCGLTASGDVQSTPANLGPLQANGGFTRTHLPNAGSAAVDTAGMAECSLTDQRFARRPQGAACDKGSVERCPNGKPAAFTLVAPADGASLGFGQPLDWTDASCATRYQVTVRRGSSTGALVGTIPAQASELVFPFYTLDPGAYAWQVKACNKKKCRSSPWRTFTPVRTPP